MNIPPDIKDCRAEFAARFHSLASFVEDPSATDSPAETRTTRTSLIGSARPSLFLDNTSDPGAVEWSATNGKGRVPNLLIPGLLGDSVRTIVAPMAFADKTLELEGYDIDVLWVNGRQGCDKNAAALYPQVMDAAQRYGAPVRLIGYSKGCTDIMHLLARHTDCHAVIDSVVSLAGVVHGTALATDTPRWLDRLVQYLPVPGVKFGDGRALDDMSLEYRQRWLMENPLPSSIRYASVVAAPASDRISRVLRRSYRLLSKTTPDNDGQVTASDSLLPDSELLAIVNADHWSVALPFGRELPFLSRWFIDQNDFPRTRLLQTIIDHLDNV